MKLKYKKGATLIEVAVMVMIFMTMTMIIVKSLNTINFSDGYAFHSNNQVGTFENPLEKLLNVISPSLLLILILIPISLAIIFRFNSILNLYLTDKTIQKDVSYEIKNDRKKFKKMNIKLKKTKKCEFCNETYTIFNNLKLISFNFSKDTEYYCCNKCFNYAIKHNMKITSINILKSFIIKNNIEYANDYRLKPFYFSKIMINGIWQTILCEDFFTNKHFNLKVNSTQSFKEYNKLSETTKQTTNDDENFWLSYLIADITDSPLLGYINGHSITGAALGSMNNAHSSNTTPILMDTETVNKVSSFIDAFYPENNVESNTSNTYTPSNHTNNVETSTSYTIPTYTPSSDNSLFGLGGGSSTSLDSVGFSGDVGGSICGCD